MNTPAADRTAKRISVEEWFERYDGLDLLKPLRGDQRRPEPRMPVPADRIAVRA